MLGLMFYLFFLSLSVCLSCLSLLEQQSVKHKMSVCLSVCLSLCVHIYIYICLKGPLRRPKGTLKRICTVLTHYDDQKSVTLMFWAVVPLLLSVCAYY